MEIELDYMANIITDNKTWILEKESETKQRRLLNGIPWDSRNQSW